MYNDVWELKSIDSHKTWKSDINRDFNPLSIKLKCLSHGNLVKNVKFKCNCAIKFT